MKSSHSISSHGGTSYPNLIHDMVNTLKGCPGVLAVAVGGSYATGQQRPDSDIDIGVYYRYSLSVAGLQQAIAADFGLADVPLTDIGGWGNWVNGGGWLTIENQRVDILYRDVDRLAAVIAQATNGHVELDFIQQPAFGFFNFMYCSELAIADPLYDPRGIIGTLKQRVSIYPSALREKLIQLFLWDAQFSCDVGGKSARREEHLVSASCKARAVFSLIQVLYAINSRWYLSEKRALAELTGMALVPQQFVDQAKHVLSASPTVDSFELLSRLIADVREQSNTSLSGSS
jgi:predicted nucleotidyltransferase